MPGCHRLAVHGWDAERGWATFALWHRYHSNGACASTEYPHLPSLLKGLS